MTKQELQTAGYSFKIRQHEVKVFRTKTINTIINGSTFNQNRTKKQFMYTIKQKHDPDYCLRKTIELATADWVLRRFNAKE